MTAIHRNSDSRACGAETVVSGQGTVYANGLLVSVDNDPNSHGAGALSANCNEVYVNGIMVVDVGGVDVGRHPYDGCCQPGFG